MIPGSGHMMTNDKPDALIAAVRTFLTGVERR